jgi:hypothetical protein
MGIMEVASVVDGVYDLELTDAILVVSIGTYVVHVVVHVVDENEF